MQLFLFLSVSTWNGLFIIFRQKMSKKKMKFQFWLHVNFHQLCVCEIKCVRGINWIIFITSSFFFHLFSNPHLYHFLIPFRFATVAASCVSYWYRSSTSSSSKFNAPFNSFLILAPFEFIQQMCHNYLQTIFTWIFFSSFI